MGLNKRLINQASASSFGADNFAPVTYTGNRPSTQSITGVGFQPDLVWIKNRGTTNPHVLTDSIRGAGINIYSNLTNGNTDESAYFTSFDSNGFSLALSGGNTNASGSNYVAWCWKAASSDSTNTDGTITSTVRANPDAGFSIVKYTGNGGTTQSVGHGLSSAPELVIFKRTNAAVNWFVFEKSGASTRRFEGLNTTGASASDTFFTPSSSTITWTGTTGDFNGNTNEYIMYCFHSVDGYQKVGSYSGTGTSNTITTGFQPRFVMIKATNNASDWYMIDSVRPNNKFIIANGANSEFTSSDTHTFTSTGFTLSGSSYNNSGYNWIYLAIA